MMISSQVAWAKPILSLMRKELPRSVNLAEVEREGVYVSSEASTRIRAALIRAGYKEISDDDTGTFWLSSEVDRKRGIQFATDVEPTVFLWCLYDHS